MVWNNLLSLEIKGYKIFLFKKVLVKGRLTQYFLLKEKDLLVVQIYVDDIIFGSTNDLLCQEFSKLM